MPRWLIFSFLVYSVLIVQVAGRVAKYAPRDPSNACSSNAECLQKGLPLLPPRNGRRRTRRQTGQAFVPITTTTCGTAETVFLPTGEYEVTLVGASGASNGASNPGGRGAILTAGLTVTSNITVGYFVGCAGITSGNVGGGGGGSFIYFIGDNEPAILVAGGGGGAGNQGAVGGRPAGNTFDGVATQADDTPGATGGTGGTLFSTDSTTGGLRGAGGGGFLTAGESSSSATGGDQSINYGGTFAGGTTTGNGQSPVSGGAGGGGGAGFFGGGGGGGWSGGGGGADTPAVRMQGGGGGSYAAPGVVGGITVIPGAIVATAAGDGYLTLTKSA